MKTNRQHLTIPVVILAVRFKAVLLSILIAVCACAVSCHQDGDSSADGNQEVAVGDSLPAFRVRLMDGSWVSRDSLIGHRSVVCFFNTGCPDCRQELPMVDSLFRSHGTKADVRIVAIAREEEAETIWDFWDTKGLTLPFSAQTDRTVYSLFAKSRIPRIYMSDTDGIVRFLHDDQTMPDIQQLEEEFGQLK